MSKKRRKQEPAPVFGPPPDDEPSFYGSGPTPEEDRYNRLESAVDFWRTAAILLVFAILFAALILWFTLGTQAGDDCRGYYDAYSDTCYEEPVQGPPGGFDPY